MLLDTGQLALRSVRLITAGEITDTGAKFGGAGAKLSSAALQGGRTAGPAHLPFLGPKLHEAAWAPLRTSAPEGLRRGKVNAGTERSKSPPP